MLIEVMMEEQGHLWQMEMKHRRNILSVVVLVVDAAPPPPPLAVDHMDDFFYHRLLILHHDTQYCSLQSRSDVALAAAASLPGSVGAGARVGSDEEGRWIHHPHHCLWYYYYQPCDCLLWWLHLLVVSFFALYRKSHAQQLPYLFSFDPTPSLACHTHIHKHTRLWNEKRFASCPVGE